MDFKQVTFTVYGKTGCGYCEKAKKLLSDLERVQHRPMGHFLNLGEDYTKEDLLALLAQVNKEGYQTYPQIIAHLNGINMYVGGFDDLENLVTIAKVFKRNLFEKRINAKPFEYPELLEFKDAIRHSYWVHSEFNYEPDKQDFLVNISPKERKVIERTMLAISQVEVTVKRFWADLYTFLPKPEIDMVGVTFADSEARHFDAYSNLLELLGLNESFENIHEIEPLMERVSYMEKFMERKKEDQQGFTLALVLFSLFVEHISLFGQFYVMMAFNKRRNQFKGLSNAVSATSKEEEIHGKFGIALYKILREEHPEIFTETFWETLDELTRLAYATEMKILDWIFEDGDLDFLTFDEVKTFISERYNNSLTELGLEPRYLVEVDVLEKTKWFDEEILVTKEEDFFNKRSIGYSKNAEDFEDIF